MASGALAARLLGPRGRGELAAIQAAPSFIGGLAMLGTHDAVAYYSARSPAEAGRYLGSAMAIALVSSLFFMAGGYVLMPLILNAQAPEIVGAGRWYLLIAPVYAMVGLPRYPFQGRRDFVPWNVMRIAPNILWIAVLMLAWAWSHAIPSLVAIANLGAMALLTIPFALLTAARIPGPFWPDPHKMPSMLRYGLPCMATMAPQSLNLWLDQMLMAALLPARQLGLYVVAVAWSGAVSPLLGAVAAVTMPAVAASSEKQQRARRLAASVRATAGLAFVLAIAGAAVTPLAIVVLFGERFRASIPAALVLVPAACVLGLNLVLQEGLRGMGQPYAALQAELTGLGMTTLALVALLRPMGIIGASIASLLGYSTVTLVLLINARHYAGTSASNLLLPRRAELRSGLLTLVSLLRPSRGTLFDSPSDLSGS